MRNSFAGLILTFALFASLAVATEVCSGGHFYNSTSEACQECPKGTFALGDDERTECIPCSEGYIASITGLSECTICKAGTFEVDRTSCSRCPAGTFTLQGASGADACLPCAAGSISNPENSACIECTGGFYELNRTSCEACPLGTFSVRLASGLDECYECSAGYVGNSDRTSCDSCEPGQYAVDSKTCAVCPAGSISVKGASACVQCPTGTYASIFECVPIKKDEGSHAIRYVFFGFCIAAVIYWVKKKRGNHVQNETNDNLIYQNAP